MARRARRPQPEPAAPPAVPVDLVQVVVEAIARGELDGELAVLGAVINERLRLLATAQSMTTLASLRVGDRVRINHSAKPNYLHGQAGTVTGWAGQNVVVLLDRIEVVQAPAGGRLALLDLAGHLVPWRLHAGALQHRPGELVRIRALLLLQPGHLLPLRAATSSLRGAFQAVKAGHGGTFASPQCRPTAPNEPARPLRCSEVRGVGQQRAAGPTCGLGVRSCPWSSGRLGCFAAPARPRLSSTGCSKPGSGFVAWRKMGRACLAGP